MTPEITLICLLAKTRPSDDELEVVRSLLHDPDHRLDWAYFLDQCYRHRVLALVAHNCDRHALFGPDGIPGRDLYRAHLLYQRSRNDALLRELRAVLDAFAQAEIKVAPRKGAYLSWAVYPDPQVRPMGDLDLLVSREHIPEAEAVLDALGYQCGELSATLRTVQPLDRGKLAFWRLHTNNAPPRLRLTGIEEAQAFAVDLVHNLFLPSSGYSLSAVDLLGQAEPIAFRGGDFWALPPELHLVDVATHLYKESTTIRYINHGRHQSLSQYRDLAELIETNAAFDWKRVLDALREHQIQPPVYFALAHLDTLYPDLVPRSVLDDLRAAVGETAPDLLDQYGAVDLHEPLRWREGLLDRMFKPERLRLAEQTRSPV